jgi:hypothetical protein
MLQNGRKGGGRVAKKRFQFSCSLFLLARLNILLIFRFLGVELFFDKVRCRVSLH